MFRILFCLCLAVLAALPLRAAADNIAGVYRGEIFSGGKHPGMTIFTISELGQISGTYVYEADSGSATGELKRCMIEVRLLRCNWHDAYGKGDFIVLFSPDFRSFEGSWYNDVKKQFRSPKGGNRWTGRRSD